MIAKPIFCLHSQGSLIHPEDKDVFRVDSLAQ
jgi:hypothetical protein